MKLHSSLVRAALALATTTLIASCDGGNDAQAGGETAFSIVPTTITLTGPDANTCGTGNAGAVFVFGGSGPYEVHNSGSGFVQVSKTKLDRPGDSFDVALAGCMTDVQIAVVDQLGRVVTLSVSSVPQGGQGQ